MDPTSFHGFTNWSSDYSHFSTVSHFVMCLTDNLNPAEPCPSLPNFHLNNMWERRSSIAILSQDSSPKKSYHKLFQLQSNSRGENSSLCLKLFFWSDITSRFYCLHNKTKYEAQNWTTRPFSNFLPVKMLASLSSQHSSEICSWAQHIHASAQSSS